MKSTMKMEDRILRVVAFGCYAFALIACGLATYSLVTLALTAYGNLGQGFYLTAPQF
jgi:hypothetical protein